MAEKLKGIQDLFSLLSRSADYLNSLFSTPVLYLVTTRIITTFLTIYFIMAPLISANSAESMHTAVFPFYLIFAKALPSLVFLAVILIAADSPVQEVLICINFALKKIFIWN